MNSSLIDLGFTRFLTQQLSVDEYAFSKIARVIEVQRTHIVTSNGVAQWNITLGGAGYRVNAESRPTIGWY